MVNPATYIFDLLILLVQRGVELIVCGGVAAVLHGVERLTMDLDLSLSMKEENLRRFISIMAQENMIPRAPVPAEVILDQEIRRTLVKEKGAVVFTFIDIDNPYKQIDVFLSEDTEYERLLDHTLEVALTEEYTIRVIDIPQLIKMKEAVTPARQKDLMDVSALQRIQERKNG